MISEPVFAAAEPEFPLERAPQAWRWPALASGVALSSPFLQTAANPHGHHLRVPVIVLHDEGMILERHTKDLNGQCFKRVCYFEAVVSSNW